MQYEVEIKSLLGSATRATELIVQLRELDPTTVKTGQQSQLNHYFKGGDLAVLAEAMTEFLNAEQREQIVEIDAKCSSKNVRTRQKNDVVLLIVKGSLDSRSAAHSHRRMEFEAEVPLTIDELDSKVIAAGYQLEAKWQAEREMYQSLGLTVDMMFSPGYGYVAEFEKVVQQEADVNSARKEVVIVMKKLGIVELPNERLERMYTYYNNNWRDYYGTKKVFNVA